ncbi:GNAT family N-acetyltransferase [Pseudonocardia sulfidoxydans]|uniref:GNAT family N-acetyltransferase n=1 Tax=Pseudonocardia sulfidoxydans TaxID=54011 RepID=UPI001FE5F292|nr:GNAT family N-acetyltransferase [Pseudonocardia sulfidoxydans]
MTSVGQVRPADVDDVDGIARVTVRSWRETYAGILAEHHFDGGAYDRRREQWTRFFASDPPPGRLVVATVDGEVVGFACAGDAHAAEQGFPAARPLHLYAIYVLAAHLGSGLGQALLDEVLDGAPAQLWVLRGNDRAIAFYTRNGFAADGVEFTDPDDPAMVEVRMVR